MADLAKEWEVATPVDLEKEETVFESLIKMNKEDTTKMLNNMAKLFGQYYGSKVTIDSTRT